jgi:hypothetical protein
MLPRAVAGPAAGVNANAQIVRNVAGARVALNNG